jgi:hypothetical protein
VSFALIPKTAEADLHLGTLQDVVIPKTAEADCKAFALIPKTAEADLNIIKTRLIPKTLCLDSKNG